MVSHNFKMMKKSWGGGGGTEREKNKQTNNVQITSIWLKVG